MRAPFSSSTVSGGLLSGLAGLFLAEGGNRRDSQGRPSIMHFVQTRAVRRVSGLACLTLSAVALTLVSSVPAGAQTAPASSGCQGSAPVLDLGNPNPGDTLPLGDTVFSGVAFDPAG